MEVLQPHREGGFNTAIVETSVQRGQRLPLDLITCTMEFLPQADLRRAASASREFYAAAHSAGLEISRTIILGRSYEQHLATFMDIVDHVSRKTSRADLTLSLECGCGRHGQELGDDDVSPAMASILQAVKKSLPLLTRLDIALSTHFCGGGFYDALAVPAPRLRSFALTMLCFCMQPSIASAESDPSSLFGGMAPQLAEVRLRGAAVALGSARIPAFARARRVELNFSFLEQPPQRVTLAASFPVVRSLLLFASFRLQGAAPRTLVDLAGLALDRLVVFDESRYEGAFEYVRVPVAVPTIKYICDLLEYHEPLWPTGKSDLNALIRQGEMRHSLVTTIGVTAGKHWSHTVYSLHLRGEELTPLVCLPPLRDHLVSLTLEEQFIPNLVRTPQTLAALRELFVDCTERMAHTAPIGALDTMFNIGLVVEYMADAGTINAAFAAPALKTVTAFARTCEARVHGHMLVVLGLALNRAKMESREQRLELILAGIQLDNPIFTLPLLLKAYRAVGSSASSDGVVPAYSDYRKDDPRFSMDISF